MVVYRWQQWQVQWTMFRLASAPLYRQLIVLIAADLASEVLVTLCKHFVAGWQTAFQLM